MSAMEAAFLRAYQSGIPEGMVLYQLTLTDASGIPLGKLGSQALEVTIPIPEALHSTDDDSMERQLCIVTLDGNGQLERLEAEREADVDVLLLYGPGDPPAAVARRASLD